MHEALPAHICWVSITAICEYYKYVREKRKRRKRVREKDREGERGKREEIVL